MKYLKYFKTDVDCQNYFSSDEFVTPNVSYVEDADVIYFKPIKSANSTIYATFSATDDNKLAIANASNVKSIKYSFIIGYIKSLAIFGCSCIFFCRYLHPD